MTKTVELLGSEFPYHFARVHIAVRFSDGSSLSDSITMHSRSSIGRHAAALCFAQKQFRVHALKYKHSTFRVSVIGKGQLASSVDVAGLRSWSSMWQILTTLGSSHGCCMLSYTSSLIGYLHYIALLITATTLYQFTGKGHWCYK